MPVCFVIAVTIRSRLPLGSSSRTVFGGMADGGGPDSAASRAESDTRKATTIERGSEICMGRLARRGEEQASSAWRPPGEKRRGGRVGPAAWPPRGRKPPAPPGLSFLPPPVATRIDGVWPPSYRKGRPP